MRAIPRILNLKTSTKYFFGLFLCFFMWPPVIAQNNLDSAQITQSNYISLISQNDWFQLYLRDDKYFTNGLHIELAQPYLNNKLSNTILWNPTKGESTSQFALSIGQDIHTPANINLTTVDSTDRPYAGLLYFNYSRVINQPQKALKFITKFYVGVIGEISGAGQLQNAIHNFNGSPIAQGWEHQIGNGLILDYELKFQKMLPISWTHLELNTNTVARIGTIHNYLGVGFTGKIGLFNFSFSKFNGISTPNQKQTINHLSDIRWVSKRKLKHPDLAIRKTTFNNRTFQLYAHFEINAAHVFYDGTAQGSLIAFKPSPYVLAQSTYNKSTVQFIYGATISYKRIHLTYTQTVLEDVYIGKGYYGWGEFKMIYSL